MRWMSSHTGELNNCATYFSSFASVSQTSKNTMAGTIGGSGATQQPWSYKKGLRLHKKWKRSRSILKIPEGKQKGDITKFIAQNKSQEFVPPIGKYADLFKAESLHNTNYDWQHWFLVALAIAMQYTNQANLKSATVLTDVPINCPLVSFLNCVKETLKCGRLHKRFS